MNWSTAVVEAILEEFQVGALCHRERAGRRPGEGSIPKTFRHSSPHPGASRPPSPGGRGKTGPHRALQEDLKRICFASLGWRYRHSTFPRRPPLFAAVIAIPDKPNIQSQML